MLQQGKVVAGNRQEVVEILVFLGHFFSHERGSVTHCVGFFFQNMESCSSLSHTTTNTQKTPRFWLLRPRFFALRFWCPCPALFLINFHLPVRNIQLEPHSRLGPLPMGHAPLLETHSGSSPSCWCRTICFPRGLMFYRGFLLFSHFFCSAVSCRALTGSPRKA